MVDLLDELEMNLAISHLGGVKRAVAEKADEIATAAKARLAAHTKTGSHQVTVSHGSVDSYVNLEGPAPAAVEFGHMVEGKYKTKTPKHVPGLYIITGAAGLAG